MRRKWIAFIMIGILVLGCMGCSSETKETNMGQPTETTENIETTENEETTENAETTEEEREYYVLFVGNSYTQYNSMPAIFARIGESLGYNIKIKMVTEGGHQLSKWADPNDDKGAILERVLTEEKFDYVILQEKSSITMGDKINDFYDAVRTLARRIRETGAEPVLYSTWGSESSLAQTNGWSIEYFTWKVSAAHENIGRELEIPVVYVGLAFYDIFCNAKEINLYAYDKAHPSYSGSYLAAATLFAGVFGADPTPNTYDKKLKDGEHKILCEAARKAVFETPRIPEEYN